MVSKVRILIIGLGNRAGKYMEWFSSHEDRAVVCAAVEPNAIRAKDFQQLHPEVGVYSALEEFLESGCPVDACVICSPDATHYQYALCAIKHGWHILLEKPMATNPEECMDLEKKASESGLVISLCYVLRHHPYYIKLKEILSEPQTGHITNVSHTVNIGLERMTHSFVRGVFSRVEESSPLVLQKCSHDFDLILWLTGQNMSKLSSYGSLSLFKEDRAPEGAALRCQDCPLESGCIFSAVDLYQRRREWIDGFIPAPGESKQDVIERELREGRYGRCVFHCNNNVVDHQTVLMQAENGMTVEVKINGLSREDNRETIFNCSNAIITADGKTIRIKYLHSHEERIIDLSRYQNLPFHAGADLSLVENFIGAINGSESLRGTSAREALASHLLCFKAEEMRNSDL